MYLQKPNGEVVTYRDDDGKLIAIANRGVWTEVQVVPLDAVVIEAPLPEVTVTENGDGVRCGETLRLRRVDPDKFEARGIELLAIARYLREHPPVDEAQVKALADDLRNTDNDLTYNALEEDMARGIARSLIAQGWSKGGAR